jgi:hypothetical protein
MAVSQFPAHAVRAKTAEVVDYHRDESQPGKPLYLLVPGGLIALGALALIIAVAYRTWFDGSMDESQAWRFFFVLGPAYVIGVFMFSYGYELYDMPKTIRLTLIIVVLTVAAVVIVAVLFALLGGSSSSSSSKSSSKSSGSSSSGSGIGDAIGSFVGGSSGSSSPRVSSSPSYGSVINPIFLSTGGNVTHEVTHEVVREVPVAPPPPQPITCPFCGRSYVPSENQFACPACGAATPPGLLPADAGTEREPNT